MKGEPANLEEQAVRLVGTDIYQKLIKGYTEKQWGRDCRELPTFIIKRIPVRYTYDNNYFNDAYQGIPKGGYNPLIDRLFAGCDVELETDFNQYRDKYEKLGKKVLYTGTLDSYYGYQYGKLEYRSLRFESETLDIENYQGVAVMNFTDRETPYTRIIEHKHFEYGTQEKTVITKEYLSPGRREESRIIRLTITQIRHCLKNTGYLLRRSTTSCSEGALRNISIMIWTR